MQGEIRYRIVSGEAPGTARVELTIGYALKGPLAQFGRPSLVRNLAGRMIAEFSRNLEARLTGGSSAAPPKAINLPRLFLNSLGRREFELDKKAVGFVGLTRPFKGEGMSSSAKRVLTTPRRDDLGLTRIVNGAGVSISLLPSGAVFAIEHAERTVGSWSTRC